MAYDKIQFVGYAINTFPEMRDGKEHYFGLPNPKNDIDARCILMRRAMETAAAQIVDASPPEKTLKVFMAPEFFFRGATGAYQLEWAYYAVEQLQKLAAEPQWQDWLFVFGTILGTWEEEGALDKAINFALIQEGGAAAKGDLGAKIVTKELKSHIDFISKSKVDGNIILGEIEHMDPGPSGPGKEAQYVNYDGAGIFKACGITWAADICKDHLEGRLIKSPQLPGTSEIQVQLVPSGGASIQASTTIAEEGGFVFNVDANFYGVVTLKQNVPPLKEIDHIDEHDVPDSDIVLADASPPETVEITQLYQRDAGSVVIYPPQDVPPEKTVPGKIEPLTWEADDELTLDFTLIYDDDDKFSQMLCKVTSSQLRADRNDYLVPLKLRTTDLAEEPFKVDVKVGAGSQTYDHSCWCTIVTDDFKFEGTVFLFDNKLPGSATSGAKKPKTIM